MLVYHLPRLALTFIAHQATESFRGWVVSGSESWSWRKGRVEVFAMVALVVVCCVGLELGRRWRKKGRGKGANEDEEERMGEEERIGHRLEDGREKFL
jgi:hypothetical protein